MQSPVLCSQLLPNRLFLHLRLPVAAFLFFTMAFHFRADQFAHMAAQLQVDLRVVNVQIQRQGDRTAQGQQGCDMASSCAHMNPLSKEAALFIFNQLSQAIKDNPGTAQRAEYIAQLARNAAEPIPAGCANLITRPIPDEGVRIYWTPGGHLFTGRSDAARFISFLFLNMDDGHRIAWPDLTGREQWEWGEAWKRCGKTHVRVVNQTRGLPGTNIGLLTTVANVRAAMAISPSLKDRRPAQHPVNAADWTNAATAAGGVNRRLRF